MVGIPYGSHPETCPVRPLRASPESSAISAGPLCRPVNRHGRMGSGVLSADAIALVVKRYAGKRVENP